MDDLRSHEFDEGGPAPSSRSQLVDVQDVPPVVTPEAAARQLIEQLTSAARRIEVAVHLARATARGVADTVEQDVAGLLAEARPPAGDRRIIATAAGQAATAVDDLLRALAEGETVRRVGLDQLAARRAQQQQAGQSVVLAEVEQAQAVADVVRRLQVPLAELDGILQDSDRLKPALTAALLRRLRAAAQAALVTHAQQVTDRLRQLEAQTLACHAQVLQGDPITGVTGDLLRAHDPDGPALPQIRWPTWSSAQSKHAKSGWVGNPFQVPTIE